MHSSVDQNKTHRLGVAFTPLETRAEVIVEAGVLAEEFGFDHFGIAEGWSCDSTHLLAEIARRTERIELVSVRAVGLRAVGRNDRDDRGHAPTADRRTLHSGPGC